MYLRVFWWYLFLTLDVSTVAISNNQSPHSFEEGFPQGQAMWPGTVVEGIDRPQSLMRVKDILWSQLFDIALGRKTAQKAFIEFFGEIPQSDLDSLGYYCRICKGCNSFAEYYRLWNVILKIMKKIVEMYEIKGRVREEGKGNDHVSEDEKPKDSDNNSEPKNSDDSELKDFDDSEPKDSDNLELEDSNDSEPKDSNGMGYSQF
ncbi:hypothetical protein GGU10DRAFT_337416 [Lentinula aff. detonsa]|uniref:Secreted protein n=1 Tax=Lentinula aff. detonsa TaxID=2804958 RepID=A0AA38L1N3_9AGAR|nr:hypothetical protein GGU10DRAFT_337416 [Lentinula aff. detonsa]